MEKKFQPSLIFEYNHKKNRITGALFLSFIFFIFIVITFYLAGIDVIQFKKNQFLNKIVENIVQNVKAPTYLGILYTSTFGGLFFLILPVELMYLNFLGSKLLKIKIYLIYLFGILVSSSVNYFIGNKASNFSIRLISPKKFYRVKSFLNRYGIMAIFIMNVLPLPSQILSTILGVISYNKKKFYITSLIAQSIQYGVITLAYWIFQ